MRFTEQERLIFGPYQGGNGERFGDPIRIYRRLAHALGGSPNQWLASYRSPDPSVSDAATERLVQAVPYAFEVPAFDPKTGEGYREDACLALLARFQDFLEKKNLKAAKIPTSVPYMGQAS